MLLATTQKKLLKAAAAPLPAPALPAAFPDNHSHSALRTPNAALLNPLETEVIDLFVQLSHLLGQPRSLAEIYGLLFISARPLAMDDLIARLQLSKGSASQGLKFLRNAGAVKIVYVPGDRRVHYEAVAELRNLVARFVRDQIVPHLDSGLGRLDRISGLVKKLPPAERTQVARRINTLQSWEKKGRRFLPLIVKLLGTDK